MNLRAATLVLLLLGSCSPNVSPATPVEEPSPPASPVEEPSSASEIGNHTEREGPCGSTKTRRGVNVSEREAIATAFGSRHITDCSRFETTLDASERRKAWSIALLPKRSGGCSYYRVVNAVTGKIGPTAGGGCP